jgi:hypothetical protein
MRVPHICLLLADVGVSPGSCPAGSFFYIPNAQVSSAFDSANLGHQRVHQPKTSVQGCAATQAAAALCSNVSR